MEEERIPTMPQGEERIPTMPQGEERIPTLPQSEERIATLPQEEEERISTVPQEDENKTVAAGLKKFIINSNVEFYGNKGIKFTILASEVVSSDSGESQIYKCISASKPDEEYVARILISVTPKSDFEKRTMRNKVIEFLENVSMDEKSHLLPLIDHGTINLDSGEYYVEIYPFCKDGDLGKRKGEFTNDELKQKVIPAINEALRRFHLAGMVHRDIKPDNLYMYKNQVVIGDFGISCELREDGFAVDRTKTGTLGYYAPELMSQAAIKASDYYSFGQTLWTLYSGEMMYGDVIRRNKSYGIDEQRNQVNFSMLNNVYYGLDEIGNDFPMFEILIRGLLRYDPSSRFDYDKVNRWLNGDRSLALEIPDYKSSDGVVVFSRSFKLCGKECWDVNDVCEALCSDWKAAIDALYDGLLKDFITSQAVMFEDSRFLNEIMKRYSVNSNKKLIDYTNNIGLAKVILHFSKNRLLCWKGKKFKKYNDFSLELEKYNKGISKYDYYDFINTGLLEEWEPMGKKAKGDVLQCLKDIRDMIKKKIYGRRISVFWLMFFLSDDRKKCSINGCNNIDEYIKYIIDDKNKMYVENVINNYMHIGIFCLWGYSRHADIFINNFNENYCNRYDLFMSFLEAAASNEELKNKVRKYYFEYGPRSYLNWWKLNINLYNFIGNQSMALKNEIEKTVVNDKASISDQRENNAALISLSQRFLELFESDYIMCCTGIYNISNNYIYSDSLLGSWYYKFLGNQAPIGFKYYIDL